MLDLRKELQKYHVIDINTANEKNSGISENVRNSVMLYNKALGSLESGSEDIAIIELKRAIAINPDFYEAMNLLGVCYSYTNEKAKAVSLFEKVVAAERNSVQALRYLELLDEKSVQENIADRKMKNVKKDNGAKSNNKQTSLWVHTFRGFQCSHILRYIIVFSAGILITLLITGVFHLLRNDSEYNAKSVSDLPKTDIGDNSGFKEKYLEANEKYEKSKVEVSKLSKELDYYKNMIGLFEAEKLAIDRQYEVAADKLLTMKTVVFKQEEKEKFESLYKSVVPKATTKMLSEGIKLLNSKKYNKALEKLSKISIYGNQGVNEDKVLYYIGKCYIGLKDSRNAVSVFQQIKQKYPKSYYAKHADTWIKSLTRVP